MAMTKQDFNEIARVIKAERDLINEPANPGHVAARTALVAVVQGIADHAKRSNSRFDRDRFFTACGFAR